jgi:hypothetical protein
MATLESTQDTTALPPGSRLPTLVQTMLFLTVVHTCSGTCGAGTHQAPQHPAGPEPWRTDRRHTALTK